MRSSAPLGMTMACLFLVGVPAAGQGAQSGANVPWTLGVSLGAGSQPDAIAPICGVRETSSAIGAAGLAVGRPISGIHLEGRLHGYMRGDIDCAPVGLELEGVHTLARPTAPGGGVVVSTDVRVRVGAHPQSLWTTAAGVGWVLGKNTPYVSWSGGLRSHDGWRWGIDLDVRGFVAPWHRETADYVQGSIVRILAEEDFRRLAFGFTVSVTAEVPRKR